MPYRNDFNSFNRVHLLGRMTKDAKKSVGKETRAVYCEFQVVTTEKFYGQGQEVKSEHNFHNIICFSKTAEFVLKYLGKGCMVMVDGVLQYKRYIDKETQKPRYFTNIRADQVLLIYSKVGIDSQDKDKDNGDNGDSSEDSEPF